jgi:hypothetical protein
MAFTGEVGKSQFPLNRRVPTADRALWGWLGGTLGVFKLKSPRAIALSLKKSSERSHRRKSTPFRSAISMLNFEINRGGRNLSAERKHVLNAAKQELRKLFGRPAT